MEAAANSKTEAEIPLRPRGDQAENPKEAPVQAIVSYEDPYVQPLILTALDSLLPEGTVKVVTGVPAVQEEEGLISKLVSSPDARVLQITDYESIDFEYAAAHEKTALVNSYMIRKALIRKHYLSTTVDHWVAKKPESVLRGHVKRTEAFEVDYAEFLDDALVEAFDLRESMERNEALGEDDGDKKEWWILKPGMSDRGQGIRLFSTMDELQAIFDGWEEDQPDTDDEEEDGAEAKGEDNHDGDYITTSHLRHFVAQPYIHPPLLLPVSGASSSNHKFHIRTYVLCVGSLTVYVYRPMLALFAGKPYSPPGSGLDDIESFLTNTCLQNSPHANAVRLFWYLPLPKETLADVFAQICAVAGDVFEAAARAMPVHFQTLPNAFEAYGLDFLVDAGGKAWLLEVNAFPDFKQTGADLRDVVGGFWEGVVRCAVVPFFGLGEGDLRDGEGEEDMVCVKRVDLGRG